MTVNFSMKSNRNRAVQLIGRVNRPVLIIWLLTILYIFSSITFSRSSSIFPIFLRIVTCVPGFAAVVLFWILAGKIKNGIPPMQMQMIGLGLLLWILADYYKLFFSLASESHPTITAWVNWGNIAGFLLITGGWLFSSIMFRQRITRLKLILDVVISCGAIALVGWLVFVFPTAEPQISNIIQINWQFTYPILDFVILSLLINLILLVRSGRLRQTMFWFLAGVISLTVGDLSSGTIIPGQPFLPGTGIDLGMVVGYSAILTGAILAVRKSVSLSEDPESEFEQTIGRRIQGILPLAMTLVLVVELGIVWQNSLIYRRLPSV